MIRSIIYSYHRMYNTVILLDSFSDSLLALLPKNQDLLTLLLSADYIATSRSQFRCQILRRKRNGPNGACPACFIRATILTAVHQTIPPTQPMEAANLPSPKAQVRPKRPVCLKAPTQAAAPTIQPSPQPPPRRLQRPPPAGAHTPPLRHTRRQIQTTIVIVTRNAMARPSLSRAPCEIEVPILKTLRPPQTRRHQEIETR